MSDHETLHADVERYVHGDDVVGDAVCARLQPTVRATVERFFSPDDSDLDDIVQESLVSFLRYLRRAGEAPRNPEAFVVTIARNRCTNLALWRRRREASDVHELHDVLPHAAASPLELIDAEQRVALLRDALEALDAECRDLLIAIYRQEAPIETLRRLLGLGSVQAVYYRRDACLKKANQFLNRRLLVGRYGETRDRGSESAKEANETRDHG
mgnify:CR=1 FL=1